MYFWWLLVGIVALTSAVGLIAGLLLGLVAAGGTPVGWLLLAVLAIGLLLLVPLIRNLWIAFIWGDLGRKPLVVDRKLAAEVARGCADDFAACEEELAAGHPRLRAVIETRLRGAIELYVEKFDGPAMPSPVA